MKLSFVLATIAAAATATAANAATYTFAFAPTVNNTAFTFSLPSSPTPALAFGNSFEVTGIATQGPSSTYNANYFFYIASAGGGLLDSVGHDLAGDQLFTGTINTPTFKLGSFALNDAAGNFAGTLTIADAAAAAVPEPATWAMMIGGFALVGAGLRRRSNMKTTVSFA